MEHGYGSAFFMDERVYAPCSPPRQHAMKTTKTSPRVIDNSRFRMQQEQAKAMIGVVPLMSFYPNRTNPREDLIKRVRAIIMKGVMSQKRIAEEIGLSQTKMSQFMNAAKRLKGWKPVEKMIEEWLVIAEHEQAMLAQYESEEQLSSSYSSCESVSSSPRMMHEPAVRNIYNQNQAEQLQVTMHSNMVIPECRQEQMYEAHPAPAFAAPSYAMPYQEYYENNSYSNNYMDDLNTSSESWNYEAGYENYYSSPENFY